MIKREIKTYQTRLSSSISSRDVNETKRIMQNIIMQTTRGVDMSPLFADVLMGCETEDVELKKMVYMFLCTYCDKNLELSILCVNTFYKDCRAANPIVRGLAVRCMSNFRVETVREHLIDEIDRLLDDRNGYVKRCALMALGKICCEKLDLKIKSDFAEKVSKMTLDEDASISLDSLLILKEMNNGVVTLNRRNIQHIVSLVSRLQPIEVAEAAVLLRESSVMEYEDVESVMNSFDPYVDCLDPSAVIETIKLFLFIAEKFIKDEKYTQEILQRASEGIDGLFNYYSSVNAQVVLEILNTILEISKRYSFFYKDSALIIPTYNDPEEIVFVKMEIMKVNTSVERLKFVMKHFQTLMLDVSLLPIILEALVEMGCKNRESGEVVISGVVELLNRDLRKKVELKLLSGIVKLIIYYNDISSDDVRNLAYLLKDSSEVFECDEEDLSYVLYLCGEYEECFNFEVLVDALDRFETLSSRNKDALLSATVKSFIRNKQRCSVLIKEVTKKCLDDVDIDLNLRAKFYMNVLDKHMIQAADIVFLHSY
ncbi:AP-2 complex subunit beta-1, putative [Entamoeba invadens IP1]|uniref:AP-2 complex subunit beta-1, putative n=1 Tax=Entamoeba invadens IP1 TaxID=370355 RepID=A0A0A1TYC4_ENTIV|nr:AP-2 complex subunit beta-1, putative [Entamoeba invadens IP1]ELP86474.1 AP-2 complex subunit beta-1, putative [Entamoeba invadens IP1]|eukprot:XP_004185820.1 AP-2 complex subunit beta-1, putative [Entamoeba invadens IP1]